MIAVPAFSGRRFLSQRPSRRVCQKLKRHLRSNSDAGISLKRIQYLRPTPFRQRDLPFAGANDPITIFARSSVGIIARLRAIDPITVCIAITCRATRHPATISVIAANDAALNPTTIFPIAGKHAFDAASVGFIIGAGG